MTVLSQIKQKISATLTRSTGLPDTALVHPVREWNIGVVTFLAVVGGGVLGAWLAYNYYGNINLGSETGIVEKLNYKRSDALAALAEYSKRKATYQELLLSAPEEMVTEEELVFEAGAAELVEAGLLGIDGQVLPQPPESIEANTLPILDINE